MSLCRLPFVVFLTLLCLTCNPTYAAIYETSFESPLVDAADRGKTPEVLRLLKYGTSPNAKGSFGTTALMRAAYHGNLEIVKILVKAGADINAADLGGATPLHLASRRGHDKVVDFLIKSGAIYNMKDNQGHTAATRALSSDNQKILETIAKHEAAQDLSGLPPAQLPAAKMKELVDIGVTPPNADEVFTFVKPDKTIFDAKAEKIEKLKEAAPIEIIEETPIVVQLNSEEKEDESVEQNDDVDALKDKDHLSDLNTEEPKEASGKASDKEGVKPSKVKKDSDTLIIVVQDEDIKPMPIEKKVEPVVKQPEKTTKDVQRKKTSLKGDKEVAKEQKPYVTSQETSKDLKKALSKKQTEKKGTAIAPEVSNKTSEKIEKHAVEKPIIKTEETVVEKTTEKIEVEKEEQTVNKLAEIETTQGEVTKLSEEDNSKKITEENEHQETQQEVASEILAVQEDDSQVTVTEAVELPNDTDLSDKSDKLYSGNNFDNPDAIKVYSHAAPTNLGNISIQITGFKDSTDASNALVQILKDSHFKNSHWAFDSKNNKTTKITIGKFTNTTDAERNCSILKTKFSDTQCDIVYMPDSSK